MPRDAGLRPDEAAIANLGGAGNATLRDEARVTLHLDVMSNLNKVVDLRHRSDICATDAGAVDCRIGADLHTVANLDDSKLRNLLDVHAAILAASVVEAVSIATETHSAM